MNRQFLTWFLVSIFFAYQYILRVLPNVISSIIMDKFHITPSELGHFLGLYYVGYTAAHIPIGILLDKLGPKLVLPISIILTFSGIIPMIISDIWVYSEIGRIITGIGSAASALGIFKIANMYYNNDKFAKMVSISVIMGLFGAMYGGLPIYSLIVKFGWSYVFIVFIMLGCILALALFFITPTSFITTDAANDNNICAGIKSVFTNKKLIIISLFGGFLVGPLEGFADGWATTFLIHVYKMSDEVASLLPSIIFIGMGIGSFALAHISEKSLSEPNNYRSFDVIICCAIAMFISMSLILTGQLNVVLVSIMLLVVGFTSAYQIIVTCKAVTYVSSNMVALATALSNMIIMIFGYFFHYTISKIIGDITLKHHYNYDPNLLIKSLLVIPIGIIIGLLGFLWFKYYEKKLYYKKYNNSF